MKKPTYTAYPHDPSEFEECMHKAPPVIMFTMGKVASKTIGRSLEGAYNGCIVHCHSVNHTGPCVNGQIGPYHEDVRFQQAWDWWQSGRPVKFISPVRDPVTRNASDFFYNFHRYSPNGQPAEFFSAGHLAEIFRERFKHLPGTQWFDRHFLPNTGIDVYYTPFLKDAGYSLTNRENQSALVVRVESDKKEILERYLDMADLQLVNRNVIKSQTYKKFFTAVRLDEEYRHRMEETKYYQHFYA